MMIKLTLISTEKITPAMAAALGGASVSEDCAAVDIGSSGGLGDQPDRALGHGRAIRAQDAVLSFFDRFIRPVGKNSSSDAGRQSSALSLSCDIRKLGNRRQSRIPATTAVSGAEI